MSTFFETPRETVASMLKHIELQIKTAAFGLRPRETQYRTRMQEVDSWGDRRAEISETLDVIDMPTRDPYTGEVSRPTRRFMCLLQEALLLVHTAERLPETHDSSFRPFVDDLVRTVAGLAQTPEELVEFYQSINEIEENLG